MPGQPAPRTWLNRQIVTHEDFQEEIHDWHVNDPLGLARNAGEEFAAVGEREIRVQPPPLVPSLKYHSGVVGSIAEWKPQSEIGGGSGGSGILGTGYYNDVAIGSNENDGLGAGNVKFYNAAGQRVTNVNGGYPVIKKILFNDETGSQISADVPSDFIDAESLFDSLTVGDFVILTSNQELGDIARYRVTSMIPRSGYYEVNVDNVANIGRMQGVGRTWQVQTVSRSIVNAADLFGIAPDMANISDNARIAVVENDEFKWMSRANVVAKERTDRIADVDAEETRATTAEAAENTRAVAAEQALGNRISNSTNGIRWWKVRNSSIFRETWTNIINNVGSSNDLIIFIIQAATWNESYMGSIGALEGGGAYSLGVRVNIRVVNNTLQVYSRGSTGTWEFALIRISGSRL